MRIKERMNNKYSIGKNNTLSFHKTQHYCHILLLNSFFVKLLSGSLHIYYYNKVSIYKTENVNTVTILFLLAEKCVVHLENTVFAFKFSARSSSGIIYALWNSPNPITSYCFNHWWRNQFLLPKSYIL